MQFEKIIKDKDVMIAALNTRLIEKNKNNCPNTTTPLPPLPIDSIEPEPTDPPPTDPPLVLPTLPPPPIPTEAPYTVCYT